MINDQSLAEFRKAIDEFQTKETTADFFFQGIEECKVIAQLGYDDPIKNANAIMQRMEELQDRTTDFVRKHLPVDPQFQDIAVQGSMRTMFDSALEELFTKPHELERYVKNMSLVADIVRQTDDVSKSQTSQLFASIGIGGDGKGKGR